MNPYLVLLVLFAITGWLFALAFALLCLKFRNIAREALDLVEAAQKTAVETLGKWAAHLGQDAARYHQSMAEALIEMPPDQLQN